MLSRLTSILIFRFFLDLREVYLSGQNSDGSTTGPSKSSEKQFASDVGNFGAPLISFFDSKEHPYWIHEDKNEESPRISNDPLMDGLFSDSQAAMGLMFDE